MSVATSSLKNQGHIVMYIVVKYKLLQGIKSSIMVVEMKPSLYYVRVFWPF